MRLNRPLPVPKETDVPPRSERLDAFVAIDFETADSGRDSACAIGLVRVEGERIVCRESHLIRPPRSIFQFTYIHGITWRMVAQERTFLELWPRIRPLFADVGFLAAHNASFDRSVLKACCTNAGIAAPTIPFLCTMRLARRTWGIRPTRLPDVCNYLGLSLNHHDALSDAEACAKIAIAAGSQATTDDTAEESPTPDRRAGTRHRPGSRAASRLK